jgi:hypothetical protein
MRQVLTAAVVAVVVAAGAQCARRGDQDDGARRGIGTLTLMVEEGGTTRSAILSCGDPCNKSSGYLKDGADGTTAACVSALMSEPPVDYLERGLRPTGKACKPNGTEPYGAVFTAEGTWLGEHIKRSFTVNDPCTAALWTYMLPLRTPQAQPLILTWANLQR